MAKKDKTIEEILNSMDEELRAVVYTLGASNNECTIDDVVDICKKYDSEYVDGETALSIGYIFGRLIPLIRENTLKEVKNVYEMVRSEGCNTSASDAVSNWCEKQLKGE